MSDTHGPEGDGPEPSSEDVGSVGDEAAKLFGALSDWARDSSGAGSGMGTGLDAGLGAGLGDGLGGLVDRAAATVSEINAHIATGSAECAFCPICRTVHVVRQTSPEVKAHLAGAASSLLQAVVQMLATVPPPAGRQEPGSGVERIDLDEPDEPDAPDGPDGEGT